MKKIVTTLILLAAAVATVETKAQDPTTRRRFYYLDPPKIAHHHEFFVGAAVAATPNIWTSTFRHFISIATFGLAGPLESNPMFKPGGAVGYKYRFDRSFSLGATFSYSGNTADSQTIWENRRHRLDRDYYTLAAEGEVRYLTRRHFSLYVAAGLGVAHCHTVRTLLEASPAETGTPGKAGTPVETGPGESFNRLLVTSQISPFGIKAGGPRFGGYLECGFGYKGLLSFGAYTRF